MKKVALFFACDENKKIARVIAGDVLYENLITASSLRCSFSER